MEVRQGFTLCPLSLSVPSQLSFPQKHILSQAGAFLLASCCASCLKWYFRFVGRCPSAWQFDQTLCNVTPQPPIFVTDLMQFGQGKRVKSSEVPSKKSKLKKIKQLVFISWLVPIFHGFSPFLHHSVIKTEFWPLPLTKPSNGRLRPEARHELAVLHSADCCHTVVRPSLTTTWSAFS